MNHDPFSGSIKAAPSPQPVGVGTEMVWTWQGAGRVRLKPISNTCELILSE